MRSIRGRLLLGAGVGVSLIVVAGGALVYAMVRASLESDFDAALRSEARSLAVLVEQDGERIETDLGEQLMPAYRADTRAPRYFELWAGSARLARSRSLGSAWELQRDDPEVGGGVLRDVTLPDGRTGRQLSYAFHPRREENTAASPGRAVLVVARSTERRDAALARLRRTLAGAGLAVVVLAVGVLLWVVRRGLRPIAGLAAGIAAIGEHDLASRVDAAGAPRELAPIAERLNQLLARLERAFARERELTADVAHELRTPLSGLTATIEVALQRERESTEYRRALERCLGITRTAARLVDSLLLLARIDARRVEASVEPVPVAAVIDAALSPLGERCAERQLRLESSVSPELAAIGDPDHVRTIVGNLLDNAVSYADADGRIRIEATCAGDRVAISVRNTCTSLEAQDAARVCDRFWRGDAARSIGDHAGLGLDLCRRLAEVNGARFDVAIANGEFTAAVELPAANRRRS